MTNVNRYSIIFETILSSLEMNDLCNFYKVWYFNLERIDVIMMLIIENLRTTNLLIHFSADRLLRKTILAKDIIN
jgi:hypothetical protein